MTALYGLLPVALFMGLLFLILAGILGFGVLVARKIGARTNDSWRRVAEELSLSFSREGTRKDPVISGELVGCAVTVSLSTRSFTTGGANGAHTRHKLSTRVEAAPTSAPDFWAVACLGKRVNPPEGLVERTPAEGEFGKKYQVFVRDHRAPGPSEELQKRLLAGKVPVSLVDGKAVWSCSGILHDEARIKSVIEDCVDIAAHLTEL